METHMEVAFLESSPRFLTSLEQNTLLLYADAVVRVFGQAFALDTLVGHETLYQSHYKLVFRCHEELGYFDLLRLIDIPVG